MRVIISALLSLWLATFMLAQEKERWRRVYTFDDATVEMNTSKVTFGDRGIGRVRFRWTWKKLQKEAQGASYKSRLETLEFKCYERRYRVYQTTLLDEKGKVIRTDAQQDPSAEWKAPKPGGMMERFFGPACGLIDEKKRKPR